MDALSLRVSEIPAEGVSLDCDVHAEELGLGADDVETRSPFLVHADIHAMGAELSVTGIVSGRILRQCVRCLKRFEDRCEVPFAVGYRSGGGESGPRARPGPGARKGRPLTEGSEEIEGVVEEEEESYTYTGDQLDLTPMIREQVILSDPMQPLCRPDCQGLCPVCGEDRNLVRCGCIEARPANPFSILRERLRNDKRSSGG